MNARNVPALLLVLPAVCLIGLAAGVADPLLDAAAPATDAAPTVVSLAPTSARLVAQPVEWSEAITAAATAADRTGSPQTASVDRRSMPGSDLLPAPAFAPLFAADQVAALTTTVADDLDAYWERAFLAEGRYYDKAAFVLVAGVTPMPCAWNGATAPGAGSFYCPWNQTVYLDLPALQLEAARYGEAGLFFTLAHEWGHHAQFQRGDLQERSRAVELAADCLAGAYLADAVARGRIAAEVVEHDLPTIVATLGDAAGADPSDAQAHGSAEQRLAMLLVGYAGGIEGCGG